MNKAPYNIATAYSKAPELLLDSIAEASGILSKQNHNSESYKFWKRIIDVMKFSFGFINDMGWIVRENEALKAENAFLKSWSRELSERLQVYESVKAEILSGTFDETVKRVTEVLNDETGK